jgi:hypothetical protein
MALNSQQEIDSAAKKLQQTRQKHFDQDFTKIALSDPRGECAAFFGHG